jgi:hypothetical protein
MQVVGALLRAEALREKIIMQGVVDKDDLFSPPEMKVNTTHTHGDIEAVSRVSPRVLDASFGSVYELETVLTASREREKDLLSLAESLRQDSVVTAQDAQRERQKLAERLAEKERRLAITQKEAIRKESLIANLQQKVSSMEHGWAQVFGYVDGIEAAVGKISGCLAMQTCDVQDLTQELTCLAREAANYRQRVENEKAEQEASKTLSGSGDSETSGGGDVGKLEHACRKKDAEIEALKSENVRLKMWQEEMTAQMQVMEAEKAEMEQQFETVRVEDDCKAREAREQNLRDVIDDLNARNAALVAGREETENELQKIQEEVEKLKLTEGEWLSELQAADLKSRQMDMLKAEINSLQQVIAEQNKRAEDSIDADKMARMQQAVKMQAQEMERVHMLGRLREAEVQSARDECERLQADLAGRNTEVGVLKGLLLEAGEKIRSVMYASGQVPSIMQGQTTAHRLQIEDGMRAPARDGAAKTESKVEELQQLCEQHRVRAERAKFAVRVLHNQIHALQQEQDTAWIQEVRQALEQLDELAAASLHAAGETAGGGLAGTRGWTAAGKQALGANARHTHDHSVSARNDDDDDDDDDEAHTDTAAVRRQDSDGHDEDDEDSAANETSSDAFCCPAPKSERHAHVEKPDAEAHLLPSSRRSYMRRNARGQCEVAAVGSNQRGARGQTLESSDGTIGASGGDVGTLTFGSDGFAQHSVELIVHDSAKSNRRKEAGPRGGDVNSAGVSRSGTLSTLSHAATISFDSTTASKLRHADADDFGITRHAAEYPVIATNISASASASAALTRAMQELSKLDAADQELAVLARSMLTTSAALCGQLRSAPACSVCLDDQGTMA